MARTSKPGLEYFPLDVNFLQDRKVRRISNRHHAVGIAALTALFCLIYKEQGYYVPWNKDTLFDLADEVGCPEKKMQDIINDCLSAGIFDDVLYQEHSVLTSKAIQEQYHRIISDSRRKNKLPQEPFWILPNGEEDAEKGKKEGTKRTENKASEEANKRTITENYAAETGMNAAETEMNVAETELNVAKTAQMTALMPQTKQETDTERKLETDTESKSETEKNKETDRNQKTKNERDRENEREIEKPPVPPNGVFQAPPVDVGGLYLGRLEGVKSRKEQSENEIPESTRPEDAKLVSRKPDEAQPVEAQPDERKQETGKPEGVQPGGSSETLLQMNLKSIGISNEHTACAITSLARRTELGGPGGTLWKILSNEYRPTLLKKNEPGDYILWALNHPAEFEDTYTGTLKKRARGKPY